MSSPHKCVCLQKIHLQKSPLWSTSARCLTVTKRARARACISAKEPYTSAKEPYTSAKEPYISAKEPCISAKGSYISAKDFYIFSHCDKKSSRTSKCVCLPKSPLCPHHMML